jgi:hypothetical protein
MAIANAIDPTAALAARDAMESHIARLEAVRDSIPESERKTVVIPAVTVGNGPDPVEGAPPAAPIAAPAEASATPAAAEPAFVSVRAGERSDAEVFARLAAFLDPTQRGPLFVSRPIRKRIYFAKYPNFAEILSANKLLQTEPEGNPDVAALWMIAGELGVVVLGSLAEHDPGIQHILTYPADATKWPTLKPFSIANNRNPYLIADMKELWRQYIAWKIDVTPTEDEMEKYLAQNG